MKQQIQYSRFQLLFVTLMLLVVISPIVRYLFPAEDNWLASLLITLSLFFVLISIIVIIADRAITKWLAIGVTIAIVALNLYRTVHPSMSVLVLSQCLSLTFLLYAIVHLLKMLFTTHRVTMDLIFASLCVYLLIGTVWAMAYSITDIVTPDAFALSFADNAESADLMRFGGGYSVYPIYYSYVTLTTLGYGDIIPTNSITRMLAASEALIGQLYIAVLVARLVGIHASSSNRKE